MDDITKIQGLRFTDIPSSVAFKNLGNSMQMDGFGVCYNNILHENISGFSVPFSTAPKGMKRKWTSVGEFAHIDAGSSLCLGLGSSSSSSDSKGSSMTACTTVSSAKETEEESTMDIELDFSLHLGNDKLPSPKPSVVSHLEPLKTQPEVDLELSLCFGTTESSITCVTPRSKRYAMDVQFPISQNYHANDGAESLLVDDGLSLSTLNNLGRVNNNINIQQFQMRTSPTVNVPSLTSNITTLPKSPVDFISGITQNHNFHTGCSKTCQVEGCGKGARGASGRCIAHGGGRRCQKPGCVKGAEGRTVYCKAHGGGRRCDYLGCTKSAEGRTDYCIAHGGGRRCSNEGCTRAARGKSGLCIRHGGGKRCQKENCTKSAEGLSGLCISHGGGRRCQYPECSKGAQGSTMFCKAHGGGKRCTYEGCSKGAEGSTPFCKGHGGGKRCSFQGGGVCAKSVHGGTLYCVAHGGGKRCGVKDCTKSARGRTAYCVRHGGGKRCQVEDCGKSAQGSTDFCKAHGGGKRCSWGHLGSEFGEMPAPCNALARGKTGLCVSHFALVHDKRVHGSATVGPIVRGPNSSKPEKSKGAMEHDTSAIEGGRLNPRSSVPNGWDASSWVHEASSSAPVLDTERRVHKGSLMSMLAGNTRIF
ncbi:unnamed protein product [Rhodiola kirilowii]